MMNKVLIKLFLPSIDKQYDVWVPVNRSIYSVIVLLVRGINEMNDNVFVDDPFPILYNRSSGKYYDLNSFVGNTDIKNGSELVLV